MHFVDGTKIEALPEETERMGEEKREEYGEDHFLRHRPDIDTTQRSQAMLAFDHRIG